MNGSKVIEVVFFSQKSIGVTLSVAVLDLSRFEHTFYATMITIVELKNQINFSILYVSDLDLSRFEYTF